MSERRGWRPRSWRQWTLRSRMTTTVVGLAAVALVLTNLVAMSVLHDQLVQRLDREVDQLSHFATKGERAPVPRPPDGSPDVGDRTVVLTYGPTGAVSVSPKANIDVASGPALGSFEEIKRHAGAGAFTVDGQGAEDFRVVVSEAPRGGYGVAAVSMNRIESTIDEVLTVGLLVSGLVLIGLALAARTVVRISLRPLTEMEHSAAQIAGGDLTARVPDTDPHTEAGRLGRALNAMLGRVEAAVAARTASEQRLRQFLADASHELRTPLTSIRGFAELFRRGGVPSGPELDDTMSRIEDEAARMSLLVEDLLLLAALDEKRPLRVSDVDLLALAANTVRDAHVRSPRRTIELAGFEPVTVLGDDHQLRQVATNLVTNALQHTPADARVTFRVTRRGHVDGQSGLSAQPDTVPVVAVVGADLPAGTDVGVWEITDTGAGVPLEHAGRIFERLYRADPHRARSHGGAGLGLAIAASIVEAHGGRIELATAPGSGASFRVLLPARPPD